MADDPVASANDLSGRADGWPHETLEQRVHRLEDAVASLQDTRQIEERVAERVTARLSRRPGPSEHVTESPRPTPPPPRSEPPPEAPSSPLPALSSPGPELVRHAWLLFDVIDELRVIVRMFFDVRYHVAWTARLTVLILVPFILTSHWWLPVYNLPIVGPVLDKVVDLLLAFFAYKALSREAQRYRQVRAARPGGYP